MLKDLCALEVTEERKAEDGAKEVVDNLVWHRKARLTADDPWNVERWKGGERNRRCWVESEGRM